jgi:hypothetical protein
VFYLGDFMLSWKLESKGVFTLANFTCDFALSLHVLLNKNYLFSLLNVQASAKSRVKSRQCKCTFRDRKLQSQMSKHDHNKSNVAKWLKSTDISKYLTNTTAGLDHK